MKSLYWIFPCYNEEECLPFSFEEINKVFNDLLNNKKISSESRLVFVDDGSKDKTWELISSLLKKINMLLVLNSLEIKAINTLSKRA